MHEALREKAVAAVRRSRADCFLVTGKADIFYLTGLELDGFCLVVTGKDVQVITPRMLCGQLRSSLRELNVYGSSNNLTALSAGTHYVCNKPFVLGPDAPTGPRSVVAARLASAL